MNELGELRKPIGSRTTLKLKTSKSTRSVAPTAPPKTRGVAKPTDWSDAHKQRMQADMDALGFGFGNAAVQQRGRGC